MNTIIGTCDICGGPVKMPTMMVDPIPSCVRCGATAKQPYGPLVEMEPPPQKNKIARFWDGPDFEDLW